ncbi:MAG: Heterodisulfide reductase, subunit B [Archaeoglobus fulgidus]|uniref:Heterodisulfide reductase, subunit B n=1 Tax=Archaeoglobus fulgidus TaxID=2234 RepID=A0A101DF85_ARCFL|nr:CoB--CoM heterodisulfide reductase iron-sulfur subunit B family protein [Archaeoglobus fulgidus]KUJ94490.1 MAG: Heterodisulfide reductase, subunit B [Archaeoglobus fulgidus]KUK07658.1 MAG: Heterodisulfide reductase, subunit B, putative [Archaeoglobus fulgidus]
MVGKRKVCGLCAASCITKAISMKAKNFTDEGLLDVDVKDVVVFACRRNVEKGKDYDATLISLLCSARLDMYLIAEVFERGAKAVVQVPCHTIRPSNILGFDDPENPQVLKELTRALGAEVPTFTRDKQCCGGAGGYARHNRRAAMEFLKLKLDSMKEEVDPDCIVVSCITCLMWMDEAQEEMRKLGMIDYSIPVFDYNQLLAICQGHDPKKVARIAATPRDEVIARILENKL